MNIVDSKYQELRNKKVKLVKVIWQNQAVEEATWERKEDMKKKEKKNARSCSNAKYDSEVGILLKEGRM